jgi:hypothetical protein
MASQLQTIQVSGAGVDLSPRIGGNTTIVASPSGTAETVVGSIPAISSAVVAATGVLVLAQVAYTVAGSGTAVTYRIRQGVTAGAGTVLTTSGATTAGIAAAGLVVENIFALDTSPTFPGQAYCLTVAVTGGSGASTVSAITMSYIIV